MTVKAETRSSVRLLLLVFALTFCFGDSVVTADDPASSDGEALLNLSLTQNPTDNRLALRTAQEALAAFQAARDPVGVARAYTQIGRCYLAMNELDFAEENYHLALDLWKKENRKSDQARVLIMLGFVENRREEFEAAISYLLQAQELVSDSSDFVFLARIASGLAYAFDESGSFESALTHYQRALAYFEQAKDERGKYRMLMSMGYTNLMVGDLDSARKYLEQAIGGLKLELDVSECNEYLARLDVATGHRKEALERLTPLPAFYESTGNLRDAAQVRLLIGEIYQTELDAKAAEREYQQALSIFRRLSDRVGEAASSFALGKLELANRNYELSEQYLRTSIDHSENVRRSSSSREFSVALSAKTHERYEAYIECLMAQHKLKPGAGFEVKAFEASEKARARSLIDFLAETRTDLFGQVDPVVSKEEKRLRTAIRAKEDYRISLLETDYKKTELQLVEQELRDLRDQYAGKLKEISAKSSAFNSLTNVGRSSLKDIQEDVVRSAEDLLLEYQLGANGSYVWAITGSSIKVYELPGREVISDAVRSVYRVASKAPDAAASKELDDATAKLGEMVLGPLAEHPSVRRLIVVTDSALSFIPFQLLQVNKQPLIAGYEVINVPSASVLVQLRDEARSRQPAEELLAAFGDSVFSTRGAVVQQTDNDWRSSLRDFELSDDSTPVDVQELFYAKVELANLKRLAGTGSLMSTRYDATRDRLEHTDLSKYSILHLATHGFLNSKKPGRSGVLLSLVDREGKPIDGYMSLNDIYSLRAPVDLVVLSACRTGLGKEIRGEGLIGLTRGFMYAGASSVVASLWTVDDEATAELMKRFYENMITKDMSPASALRAAQNSIRNEPRWSSPYYWAAFTIQGDYQQKIRVKPRQEQLVTANAAMGIGAMLVLSIGAGFYLWKSKTSRFH